MVYLSTYDLRDLGRPSTGIEALRPERFWYMIDMRDLPGICVDAEHVDGLSKLLRLKDNSLKDLMKNKTSKPQCSQDERSMITFEFPSTSRTDT